jgi:NarL family two-component system response regulator LiaR
MTQSIIRVMIVDDHAVVRSGLATFLLAFDDLELVGEASNGYEAVQLCEKIQPDVVLMDLVMPKMDGPTATKLIKKKFPRIQIVALTSFKEDSLMYKVLEAGAIGYLLKNIGVDELADAVRAAYAGEFTLTSEATQTLVQAATHHPEPISHYDLTDREVDVLVLMIKGLNNSKIAEKLVISLSTVRFHVSNILAKLEVSSRTEAVALAVRNKLVMNNK